MKININNNKYILLFLSVLMMACQSELNEVIDVNEEREPIAPNSTTAQAIKKAASLDGSQDNIIDGASCLSVVYPLNVIVNSIPVEVLSDNDLNVIEGIFDSSLEDEDILEIQYPITLLNENHEEIIVNNDSELQALAAQCEEGGIDFDIECIDFSYPLTFFVYNTISETTSRVVVDHDRNLFVFVDGFTEEEIVSLSYPVNLVTHDDEIITVNNNLELTTAIEAANDDCDEDDDNDFDDDDFEEGELELLLVQCPWEIAIFKRDGTIQPYSNWTVTFDEDGTVVILDPLEIFGINGTWSVRFSEDGTFVDLEMGTVIEFSLQWKVNKVDNNTIFIYSSSGNFLKLDQKCDDGEDESGEAERILTDKSWSFGLLQTPNPQDETDYLGSPLSFKENGIASLRINGIEEEGSWQYISEGKAKLRITFGGRPSLSLAWDVDSIEEESLKLSKNNKRLELNKIDEDEANTGLQNVKNWLQAGEDWNITSFTNNGNNITNNFNGLEFNFETNGLAVANTTDDDFEGSWLSYRNNDAIRFELNFGDTDELELINGKWQVITASESQIKLEITGGNTNKTLIIEN
jgi:hypothetical protein